MILSRVITRNLLTGEEESFYFNELTRKVAIETYFWDELLETLKNYIPENFTEAYWDIRYVHNVKIPGIYYKGTTNLILPSEKYMSEKNITEWNIGYKNIILEFNKR